MVIALIQEGLTPFLVNSLWNKQGNLVEEQQVILYIGESLLCNTYNSRWYGKWECRIIIKNSEKKSVMD